MAPWLPRSSLGSVVLGSSLFVMGGTGSQNGFVQYFNDIWTLDLNGNFALFFLRICLGFVIYNHVFFFVFLYYSFKRIFVTAIVVLSSRIAFFHIWLSVSAPSPSPLDTGTSNSWHYYGVANWSTRGGFLTDVCPAVPEVESQMPVIRNEIGVASM